VSQGDWPYPYWVAHRGAGKLAPENTLAAFRVGEQYGYRMFECDVKLSADGVPFLLHDETLDRTTNSQGPADALTWSQLAVLDAGSWHSAPFAGERLLSLQALAQWCLAQGCLLNIELKPVPSQETLTGTVVANAAAQLWSGSPAPPLLTSFKLESLRAAKAAQPQLPRGLLLDEWTNTSLQEALALECRAVVCQHRLWDEDKVGQVHAAGMRALSYTVNEAADVERLDALGADGIITDRVDVFAPD
jgi:glycerophosphoryl diester phosphodiesterase